MSEGPTAACPNWISVLPSPGVMGTRCDWPFRHSRAPSPLPLFVLFCLAGWMNDHEQYVIAIAHL
jgi:hypothetical protein